MTILALDSSSRTACAALYREGVLLGQSHQNNGLTHSQTLMPMVASLLKNTGITADALELVAVTHGPGSFTGLRIGVSTAAGLAWGLDIPCCGLSSLEVAAMGVRHMGGLICAVMDARRGQVYNALFDADDGRFTRLTPDRASSLDELWTDLKNLTDGDRSSDDLQRPCDAKKNTVLVGDGAQLCYNHRGEQEATLAPAHLRHPTAWAAAVLAEQAVQRGETYPADRLRPVYLRPSQAERERHGHPTDTGARRV